MGPIDSLERSRSPWWCKWALGVSSVFVATLMPAYGQGAPRTALTNAAANVAADVVNHAAGVEVEARSIADTCQFIYRIETDFALKVDPERGDAVKIWLRDIYSDAWQEPTVYTLESGRLDMSLVTMSQNPRYLAHELCMAPFFQGNGFTDEGPAQPTLKATFSGLMERCHEPWEREMVPFTPLSLSHLP